MGKKIAILGSIMVVIAILASTVFAGSAIKLFVNNEEIKPDSPPQIIDGRAMVPVRWVSEALGADVRWDETNREVRITKGDVIPISMSWHLEADYNVRFVEEQRNLLLSPYDASPVLNTIQQNTLIEVYDMAEVNGDPWIFVGIPVYDTPINNRGWVREGSTIPFTEELEERVQSDVTIKADTKIYLTTDFANIAEDVAEVLTRDVRGRLVERKNGFVHIFAPGGEEFWVNQEKVLYPSAK